MKKISTVILDMYGVIIKERRGNFPAYIAENSPRVDKANNFDATDRTEYNKYYRPTSANEISYDSFMNIFGFTDADTSGRDYITNYITFDHEFINFADRCHVAGITLALLSNDIGEWSRMIREIYNIEKYFKLCVVSGDVGIRKPDRAIFELTLKQLDDMPESCLFVDDDNLYNLKTANSLGLNTALFRREEDMPDDISCADFATHSFGELWNIVMGSNTPEQRSSTILP